MALTSIPWGRRTPAGKSDSHLGSRTGYSAGTLNTRQILDTRLGYWILARDTGYKAGILDTALGNWILGWNTGWDTGY